MIQVSIWERSTENGSVFVGIDLAGHAGFAESGQDIVCAAVSALVLNTANSIEAFTQDGFEGQVDEENGGFSLRFTEDPSPESQLLMSSLVLGLQNIEKEYGEEYIIIRFEEV